MCKNLLLPNSYEGRLIEVISLDTENWVFQSPQNSNQGVTVITYLHSYGLSGFLPVENTTGCELWLQGVLLDGGFHRPALTGNDDVGVCTWVATCKFQHGS